MIPKKPADKEKTLQQMAALCARSEQCSFDIERKLRLKRLSASEVAEILQRLKELRFIDDTRFARSFTNDKVRFSGWGVRKISLHLAAKRIPREAIVEAIEQIDPHEYMEALRTVAKSKATRLDLNVYEDIMKLLRALVTRGYEPDKASAEVRRIVDGID